MKIGKIKIIRQYESAIFIFLIIALLLFDRKFSKMAVIEPIFVHDFLLMIATVFALHKTTVKFKFPPLLLLIIISLLYLLLSILFFNLKGAYFILIFRQYFLFFYLSCSYIIANKVFRKKENIIYAISFIKKLAKISLILQLLYFTYLYITIPNYTPLKGFSYLSAVGVMGIIIYGGYVLVYYKNFKRIALLFFTLLTSAMLGHSSSFFAVFSIVLVYFYISFSPRIRFITLGLLGVIMLLLLQLPQFTDDNANWRLMYWGHTLDMAIFNNGLILGNGFGRPYMTLEFAQTLADKINSKFMLTGINNEYERWVTPPHNSFLTMIHHLGIAPILLFFMPLKKFFNQIFFKNKSDDSEELFLFLSLFGLMTWASFNVILEVPHSAICFWLIYFTYIFYEKRKK